MPARLQESTIFILRNGFFLFLYEGVLFILVLSKHVIKERMTATVLIEPPFDSKQGSFVMLSLPS